MFATVLHHLKSPENTGMIVRTHVALGGAELVMVGPEPWRFKKRSQAFSRRLEKVCRIVHLPDDEALFDWFEAQHYEPVAVEIAEPTVFLPDFAWPARPAVIVGHEGKGLSPEFLARCRHIVTIPQFGPVACLNAAVSCCIALYELNRTRRVERAISGSSYCVADSERPAGFDELLPPHFRAAPEPGAPAPD